LKSGAKESWREVIMPVKEAERNPAEAWNMEAFPGQNFQPTKEIF